MKSKSLVYVIPSQLHRNGSDIHPTQSFGPVTYRACIAMGGFQGLLATEITRLGSEQDVASHDANY